MEKYVHEPNVWVEINYPFPNFNRAAVNILELMCNLIPYIIDDLSILECVLIHVSQNTVKILI